MIGLNASHLRAHVIAPVLKRLGLYSKAAEDLVLGTALQESAGHYLVQLGGGPALGIYQMEPATHDDIWRNYLGFRGREHLRTAALSLKCLDATDALNLTGNLLYATAMCRIHYYRVPKPLPEPGDVDGYARYWKAHYNTAAGKGTVDEFTRNFQEA